MLLSRAMRAEGLEPPRAFAHRHLKPARLTRFRHARAHNEGYRRDHCDPEDADDGDECERPHDGGRHSPLISRILFAARASESSSKRYGVAFGIECSGPSRSSERAAALSAYRMGISWQTTRIVCSARASRRSNARA